jgi:hypothetical protein
MSAQFAFVLATAASAWMVAQTPTPTTLPATLPPTITGTPQPPAVITPVSAPATKPVVPADRFAEIGKFPPETAQCIYGIRGASDWLAKMHQANGRVLPGVNPGLASVWEKDSDAKQALAMLGLCQAARFSGDANVMAKAGQSLLTIMAGLKPDPADPNRLTVISPAADKTTVAACLILAAFEMPGADARTLAIAEHMAAFLRSAVETDPLARGLVMRALAVSFKMKPADWKRDAAMAAISAAAGEVKTKPNAVLSAGLMTAAADLSIAMNDPKLATLVYDQAEVMCANQYDRTKARGGFIWAGAVKINEADDTEPSFEMTAVAMGLTAATQLARSQGDLTRYARYRQATVESLMFVRGLQASPETASHFEAGFRARSVVGGVRSAVTDPILRADATALALGCYLRFVESGCENRE